MEAIPKQALLSAEESERLWLMTNLCGRYRRMLDELPTGIEEAGAVPFAPILRRIDPTIEDALWHMQNAVAKELVLGLVRLSDPDKDALSLHKALGRLRSGTYSASQAASSQVEATIGAYLTAVEPFQKDRDQMLAHSDRRHPQSARFDVHGIDEALECLVRALTAIDAADGRPHGELANLGSAVSLGVLIGHGMIAQVREEQ